MTTRREQAGFTLIELMLAALLIGVVLSLGLGAYQRLSYRLAIQNFSNSLIHALQHARLSAMTHGDSVAICAVDNVSSLNNSTTCQAWTTLSPGSANHLRGWLVFIDNDEDGQLDTMENLLLSRPFDDYNGKVGILAINSSGNAIRFANDGLLLTSGRTLTVGASNENYSGTGYDQRIVIAANTGRIRREVVD